MSEVTLEKLLELIKRYNPESVDIVKRAYEYADLLHDPWLVKSKDVEQWILRIGCKVVHRLFLLYS